MLHFFTRTYHIKTDAMGKYVSGKCLYVLKYVSMKFMTKCLQKKSTTRMKYHKSTTAALRIQVVNAYKY